MYAWTGRQHTAVTREKITAQVIRALAKEVMVLNEYIAELDKLSAVRFREHELAEVISSMPGIGPLLGAEFLAATAGVMADTAPPTAASTTPRPATRLYAPRSSASATAALLRAQARQGTRRTQAVLALARRR
ncbi:hypothetical protein ABT126_38335 [Streptomyces sp. NPDC002012]|uniref:hypothetical protein n=1 Tax=Streptomyces sp. NPDC002012 TaxID=3154532 RepID=UPI00331F116C